MFLCILLHDQNFQKAKFIPEKKKSLWVLPSFSLSMHKIALGVLLLWRLHVFLALKQAYTNEMKIDWKPLNTRTCGLLAQEDPDLQIVVMFGTKITLAAVRILTMSHCYPLADMLEINKVDWRRKNLSYAMLFYVLCRLMFSGDCLLSNTTQNCCAKQLTLTLRVPSSA